MHVNYVPVYVCYGCERSCICMLGVLIMSLYKCVRGGRVYVCRFVYMCVRVVYMCVRGVNYVPVYVC